MSSFWDRSMGTFRTSIPQNFIGPAMMTTITETLCGECRKKQTLTSISDLPSEILVHLFAFSPLRTRKSVKHVCRKWYDCATRESIVKNEKFAFRADADLDEVCALICQTNYPHLNFTFEKYPIIEVPTPVWEACGDRVHTLELVLCEWDDDTLVGIISCCANLASLAVEMADETNDFEAGDIGGFFAILSSLNITRPRLHTFTFYTNLTLVRESVLSQVMSVCPNIRHLNIAGTTHNGRFIAYPQHESAALATCLHSVAQLESFKFNLDTNGHWLETLTAKASAGEVRLTRFETVLDFEERLEEPLLAFFSSQEDLRRIYLDMRHCDNNKTLKRLVYHILDSCPKLREFYFQYHPATFHLESSELARFVRLTSKLQHLTLGLSADGPGIYPQLFPLPSDPPLAILGLVRFAFSMEPQVAADLLPQYNSLQHLEISANSDTVLQTIFEHLTNLKTLLLANVEGCTDFGFTGADEDRSDGFSINRLQSLENLVIGSHSPGITKKTIEHVEIWSLMKITFARIDALWRLSEEEMSNFGRNVPNVNSLRINMVGPSDDSLKVLCRSMEHLSYLYVGGLMDKTELVSELFALCPHLRSVTTGPQLRSVFNLQTKSFVGSKRNPPKHRIEDRGFWHLR